MKIENRIKKQYSKALYNELFIFYYLCVNDMFYEEDILEYLNISKRTLQRYISNINSTKCYKVIHKRKAIDEVTNEEYPISIYSVDTDNNFIDNTRLKYGSHIFIGPNIKYHHKSKNPIIRRRYDFLYEVSLVQRKKVRLDSNYYNKHSAMVDNLNKADLFIQINHLIHSYYTNMNDRSLKRDFDLLFDVFRDVNIYINEDDQLISKDCGRLININTILTEEDYKEVKKMFHREYEDVDKELKSING